MGENYNLTQLKEHEIPTNQLSSVCKAIQYHYQPFILRLTTLVAEAKHIAVAAPRGENEILVSSAGNCSSIKKQQRKKLGYENG